MLGNDFQMGKFQATMLQLAVWKIQDANMVNLVLLVVAPITWHS